MLARVAGLAVSIAPAVVGLGLAAPGAAAAHETDQYTMPLDRPMADLGDYFDAVHYAALQAAVEKLNKETAAALADRDPKHGEAELNRVRSPVHVVGAVFQSFDDAFSEIQEVEVALRGDWAEKAYPGQIAIWRPDRWVYAGTHFWLDPRRIVLQFDSSTVKAYGVYFGTDKLSHFHHMGRMYYELYLERREKGMSESEAIDYVVSEYSTDSGIGEAGLLGFMATGVYSNADLAADYSGFKFCRNVLEPVYIKGETRPPMIVRKGEYFRLNKHVRPESGFFGAFVSDHWNEALNPSWWEWDIHDDVVANVEARGAETKEFYTKIDGRPRDPQYFDRLARELSTMDGEEYGHCKEWGRLLTLGQACWPSNIVAPTEPQRTAGAGGGGGPPAAIALPGQ
jgi:hypothetical protein